MIRWGFAVVAMICFSTTVHAQTLVERGDYLVNSILTCGNCHTPRASGGVLDMSKQLSGGPQTWDEPTFKVKGSNITPDPDTGLGKWSDADIKRALQEGNRPDGTPLAPIMPFGFYKIFTPNDLNAVVAYIKSVSPVKNAVEPPVYKAEMHSNTPPGAEKPMSEADMNDPVKRGFYLVTIGHCMECHTPVVNERHNNAKLGTGGQEFKGPWGVTVARNITSHKEKGIGAWSDAEIKAAITAGIRNDGTKLKPPMRYSLYANMTEQDIGAVIAYLRTVPSQE